MKKILIIGSGGAGKTTFAKRLHAATNIEIIHLDKLYWQPNWTKIEKEKWKTIIENLLEKDSWIMDGNYSGTLEMRLPVCDAVAFLDLPRLVCLYRILKRIIVYRKKTRPDMTEGCAEKLDLEFLRWIWDYPKNTKPKIETLIKRFESEKKIFHLESKREVENFFESLDKQNFSRHQ
ncbi:MAG: DNA topology modulation protein [Pyrinomonadaceae bacterium]